MPSFAGMRDAAWQKQNEPNKKYQAPRSEMLMHLVVYFEKIQIEFNPKTSSDLSKYSEQLNIKHTSKYVQQHYPTVLLVQRSFIF